eukprot:scaffold20061_cov76-Phaeocystis_antarctica.AAC.1
MNSTPGGAARRCVDVLLAVQEEQHDVSRAHAAIVGEVLPRGFEAVGDRGVVARRHLVDSRVDHGRVVRPWHARGGVSAGVPVVPDPRV